MCRAYSPTLKCSRSPLLLFTKQKASLSFPNREFLSFFISLDPIKHPNLSEIYLRLLLYHNPENISNPNKKLHFYLFPFSKFIWLFSFVSVYFLYSFSYSFPSSFRFPTQITMFEKCIILVNRCVLITCLPMRAPDCPFPNFCFPEQYFYASCE